MPYKLQEGTINIGRIYEATQITAEFWVWCFNRKRGMYYSGFFYIAMGDGRQFIVGIPLRGINLKKYIGRKPNIKNRITANLFIFDSTEETWENEILTGSMMALRKRSTCRRDSGLSWRD